MKLKSHKFVSLFLIFSLLALSGNLYAKKHGAKLIVTKTDGQQIEGELITVKENSLLLLSITGRDVSVDISEIKAIKIVKKSKVLKGIGTGFLIGAGIGTMAALGMVDPDPPSYSYGTPRTEGEAVVGGVIVGGFLGGIIGAVLRLASKGEKTIQIEGKSPRWIEFYLKKLRKKARIRDYK